MFNILVLHANENKQIIFKYKNMLLIHRKQESNRRIARLLLMLRYLN